MIKEFTYTGLKPVYMEANTIVGSYMWMHEYCHHFLNDNEEYDVVTLTMDGEGHPATIDGKVYTWEREKKDEAKVVKLWPKR